MLSCVIICSSVVLTPLVSLQPLSSPSVEAQLSQHHGALVTLSVQQSELQSHLDSFRLRQEAFEARRAADLSSLIARHEEMLSLVQSLARAHHDHDDSDV